MPIIESYKNYCEEFADTCAEQNEEIQNKKIASITFKTFGALLMGIGAKGTWNAVKAYPKVPLRPMGLLGWAGLAILGHDFGAIGHSFRETIDKPVTQTVKVFLDIFNNSANMGAERGITYTKYAYHAQNTIIISKIIKVAVHLKQIE